jgi:hypothetical protein
MLSRRNIVASAAASLTLAVQAVAKPSAEPDHRARFRLLDDRHGGVNGREPTLPDRRLAEEPTNAPTDANAEAIAAAMSCLDEFINAWNAHDLKALQDAMNFPHVRLNSDNSLRVSSRSDMTQEIFERMQKTAPSLRGWHHSAWAKREVVAASPNKVHIQTRFVRYRADNSVLSSFDSLYVVTKENGHWGVRMRSSFAP